jgi:serine/threonine-protein kinase
VIHRDLKPANIKVDPDDKVKILDFGLAKALTDPGSSIAGDPTNSPTVTLTMGGTVAGIILGTAAYMAPEQARGKKVDRRADIWAFGVVAWEMLTGERLFQGEDTVQVLGRVLEQLVDLERVPARFRKMLGRCLDRNPKERLRDIGEARFLLVEPEGGTESASLENAQATSLPHKRTILPWAVAAVLAVSTAVLGYIANRHIQEDPPRVAKLTVPA